MIIKYYGDKIEKNMKSIVLCGPTPRDSNVKSWRPKAISILEDLKYDGIVYIPENGCNQEVFKKYIEQVEWEREVYINSTIILFWIPRKISDMLGLTTNVEFGYWLKSKKCIYGRPENAERIRYLDWLYSLEYNKIPSSDLKELLINALEMVNNLIKE